MISAELLRAHVASLRNKKIARGLSRAARKASRTSLRDMKSEARKQIRASKSIKARKLAPMIKKVPNRGRALSDMSWAVKIRGDPTRVSDYPIRQTKRGVVAEIDKGNRKLIEGAFIAVMRSGHRGVFLRRGAKRYPIRELLATRPSEALTAHAGDEAVAVRGGKSFMRTILALLESEITKATK